MAPRTCAIVTQKSFAGDAWLLADHAYTSDTPVLSNFQGRSSVRQSTAPITATDDGREWVWMSSSAPAFERDVLALRSAVYGRPASECRDAYDEYSEHYVAYRHGVAHYALRATRAAAGPIECEEFYPRQIVDRFRDRLGSSGRLVRNPAHPGGREHSSRILAAAWSDLLTFGIRIDIANAIDKLLPYHSGYGYVELDVPTFIHPVFGTVSYTIAMTADPDGPGTVPPLLPRIADPMRVSDLGIPTAFDSHTVRRAA